MHRQNILHQNLFFKILSDIFNGDGDSLQNLNGTAEGWDRMGSFGSGQVRAYNNISLICHTYMCVCSAQGLAIPRMSTPPPAQEYRRDSLLGYGLRDSLPAPGLRDPLLGYLGDSIDSSRVSGSLFEPPTSIAVPPPVSTYSAGQQQIDACSPPIPIKLSSTATEIAQVRSDA